MVIVYALPVPVIFASVDNEESLIVAVITPPVSASRAFASATEILPLTVTAAEDRPVVPPDWKAVNTSEYALDSTAIIPALKLLH